MNRKWELGASAWCGMAAIIVPMLLADFIPVTLLERTRIVEALPRMFCIVFAAFGFVFAISARRQRGITLGRILLAWMCMLWNGYVLFVAFALSAMD